MERKKQTEPEIELRSEEFQEVLGGVPPWILRWGIVAIASIVAILLAGSAVFKYPEIIPSAMTLTGTTPAASVVAKASGKLRSLEVKDDDEVGQGQRLAVIDNPACTQDVETLKKYLAGIVSLDSLILPPKELALGDMQGLYASFYLTLTDYLQFKQLNYYPQKIDYTRERLRRNEAAYEDYLRQKDLIESQAVLTREQYRRDSTLCRQGVISREDLERSLSQYLQSRLSIENCLSTLQNLRITLVQLRESLLDAENQYIDRKRSLETQLVNHIAQLSTAVQTWELNYVLTAPIAGRVSFTNYWAENQNVIGGQEVFSIIPADEGRIIGKAMLPVARSGKDKKGQKVNVRFQNFPENEYGIVRGLVDNISQVPVTVNNTGEMAYVVSIALPGGLKTNYGKELPFLPQMQAQADIITDDLSVLERFFLPLKRLWKEGME